NYKLDVKGNINCSDLYINNISLSNIIDINNASIGNYSNLISSNSNLNYIFNSYLNTSNSNLKFLINENFNINNSYLNTSNSNLKFLINDNFNINNSYLNTSNSNLKFLINENSNLLLSKINDNIQNGSLFSNLNTDTISIGTSNRFIVNDIYDRNVLFSGTLTASNLNIIGNYNIIETNVYESDKIELINYGTSTTLIVNQTSNYKNVAEFYNNTNPTFIITSNSNIGIGIINPNTNYKLDVKGNINCSDLYINNSSLNEIIESNIKLNSNLNNSNLNLKTLINDNFSNQNLYLNNSNSNLNYNINITSNKLLSNINSITTDTIPLGTSNRFIVNNIYSNDVLFSGTLIASNLKVIGNTTIFKTNVYQSEKIEIINDGTATSLITKQTTNNKNVAEFYNNTNPTFIITSNSNIGIGIINPNT
ncbi:MAG: hypothetical protein EBU80_12955, partial [Chitinophagia bacterium]|nr:hypothetical protein [Chitinophagia bacterium]